MHYAASTLFIFHRRLRILSHWYSCAFRYHILKSELTSAMQSVVGVALLRHTRLPRRHALCSLHTIHLSQKIARILSRWYSCAFREHILKSELTSAMQSVVGVALLRHFRLPAPTCTMQPPHYSSFTDDCESCHVGIRALSANIS